MYWGAERQSLKGFKIRWKMNILNKKFVLRSTNFKLLSQIKKIQ